MYSPGRIFYIACQKRLFDKLVDGGVNYPQFAMVTLLRLAACSVPLLIGLTSRCFAHSARASCAPRHCHPLNQFPLKSYGFPGAETVRKRFLLWKMGFSDAKIAPPPPYTPPGTMEVRKGFAPLFGFSTGCCGHKFPLCKLSHGIWGCEKTFVVFSQPHSPPWQQAKAL